MGSNVICIVPLIIRRQRNAMSNDGKTRGESEDTATQRTIKICGHSKQSSNNEIIEITIQLHFILINHYTYLYEFYSSSTLVSFRNKKISSIPRFRVHQIAVQVHLHLVLSTVFMEKWYTQIGRAEGVVSSSSIVLCYCLHNIVTYLSL